MPVVAEPADQGGAAAERPRAQATLAGARRGNPAAGRSAGRITPQRRLSRSIRALTKQSTWGTGEQPVHQQARW